jgi:hypothetical protein
MIAEETRNKKVGKIVGKQMYTMANCVKGLKKIWGAILYW